MTRHVMVMIVGLGIAAAAVASAKDAGKAKQSKEIFRWSGKAGTVFLRNLNGPMEVVGTAKGGDVEVVAVAHWTNADPAKTKVEAKTSPKGVTICTLYPAKKASCGPDGDYEISNTERNYDLSVTYQVKLPAGTLLDIEAVNGAVSVKGLAADGKIEAVNGSIEVEATTGALDIEAVNGHVKVKTGGTGDVDIEAVNGEITVQLADGNAVVDAETVQGRIELGGERFRGEGRKTLGKGGRRVSVETVNGGIEVK
jgi:hypothetical protein